MKAELSPEEVIAEFQRRRRTTLHALRGSIAVHVGGWVVAWANGNGGPGDPWYRWAIGLAALAMIGGSLLRIIRVGGKLWRCPVCEQVPMSWNGSLGPTSFGARKMVELNPDTCGNCGSQLASSSSHAG
jgi:hypothetical protein